MLDLTPPFPEEVLTEIGRVAVAATKLEFMLAQFASETCGNMPAADLLSRPGRVLPAARQAADSLEPSIARLFRQWVDHAEQLLDERHRVIHSIWMLRAAAPGVAQYFAQHPRTKHLMDAEPDAIGDIAAQLNKCSDDGFTLIFTNASRLRAN